MQINQNRKKKIDNNIDTLKTHETKLKGVEFDGIMCSATAEDMWGLTSVATGLASFDTEYHFKFDNGNVLVINRDNYTEFMAVWTPFRASFF